MNACCKRITEVMRQGCLCAALLFALCAPTVIAQSVPEHVRMQMPEARLQGRGVFSWFGLKIYNASLWSESPVLPDQFTKNGFALDLHYARRLRGEKIAVASIDEIKKLNLGDAARHRIWLANMQSVFPDVEKGTHLTGVYTPGKATLFFRDGKPIGEIADPEFGPAFFAIWLDPKTSEPQLRLSLLGLK